MCNSLNSQAEPWALLSFWPHGPHALSTCLDLLGFLLLACIPMGGHVHPSEIKSVLLFSLYLSMASLPGQGSDLTLDYVVSQCPA